MHLHKGITGQDERRDADPAVWTSRSHGAKRQVLVERRVVDPPAYAEATFHVRPRLGRTDEPVVHCRPVVLDIIRALVAEALLFG